MSDGKKVSNNIIMLYILNITQLILPLVTLPYLTRVLSVSSYGVVSYVKSIMMYVTLLIEFGYILSGTKQVVEAKGDKEELGKIVGTITQGKLLLSLFALCILLMMIFFIPILRNNYLFTLLSFIPSFLTIFLCDYLFRGLERMQVVSIRYLIMKGISTILTFVFIKSDKQLILIPVLDIFGTLIAIAWIFNEIKHMGLHISFSKRNRVISSLKSSFIYFASDMASTAFGAFNTFCVGIFLSARSVAFWGVIMSIITAAQSMFSPISDGIYPRMIDKKSIRLFIKIILFFMPFLIIGAFVTYYGSELIILIIGGAKYKSAAIYLREFIPLIIISFFSITCGWPLLGAINKEKEMTFTTIFTAILQVVGVLLLIVTNNFTIPSLIVVRTMTELVLAILRVYFSVKYRYLFNG